MGKVPLEVIPVQADPTMLPGSPRLIIPKHTDLCLTRNHIAPTPWVSAEGLLLRKWSSIPYDAAIELKFDGIAWCCRHIICSTDT